MKIKVKFLFIFFITLLFSPNMAVHAGEGEDKKVVEFCPISINDFYTQEGDSPASVYEEKNGNQYFKLSYKDGVNSTFYFDSTAIINRNGVYKFEADVRYNADLQTDSFFLTAFGEIGAIHKNIATSVEMLNKISEPSTQIGWRKITTYFTIDDYYQKFYECFKIGFDTKRNPNNYIDIDNDKNLIMNSEGYDRLRSKTMVYPLPQNDMVLTRSTHVLQVANVSTVIAKQLGLNISLVQAIAQGHDIGHAPFGHDGERALKNICKKYNLQPFWHEKNGVRMVDKFLTNINASGEQEHLNLTYAVRDGIISHCGEVDDNFIRPREMFCDLNSINQPAQYQPYTWEGVVVKISDKIAYLGRDIEDAVRLGFYNDKNLQDIKDIVLKFKPDFSNKINNTSLIDLFIKDIVKNSTPEKGIGFSKEVSKILETLRKYNTENLYKKDSVRCISQAQANEILLSVFNYYDSLFSGVDTIKTLKNKNSLYANSFRKWLVKYASNPEKTSISQINNVYNLNDRQDYRQAIIDYLSGMTDSFALKTYQNCMLQN